MVWHRPNICLQMLELTNSCFNTQLTDPTQTVAVTSKTALVDDLLSQFVVFLQRASRAHNREANRNDTEVKDGRLSEFTRTSRWRTHKFNTGDKCVKCFMTKWIRAGCRRWPHADDAITVMQTSCLSMMHRSSQTSALGRRNSTANRLACIVRCYTALVQFSLWRCTQQSHWCRKGVIRKGHPHEWKFGQNADKGEGGFQRMRTFATYIISRIWRIVSMNCFQSDAVWQQLAFVDADLTIWWQFKVKVKVNVDLYSASLCIHL